MTQSEDREWVRRPELNLSLGSGDSMRVEAENHDAGLSEPEHELYQAAE